MGPGSPQLAIKGDNTGGPSLQSEMEGRSMRVKSSGHKARPPGFNPSSVFWSYVTLSKCQNCSVPVFPAVKWGNESKGTFLIRWLKQFK